MVTTEHRSRAGQPPAARPSYADYEVGKVPIASSAWPAPGERAGHPALTHDLDADVLVIGAGLAGASLALHLAERGVDVALLEARQPADGADPLRFRLRGQERRHHGGSGITGGRLGIAADGRP
jgi:hypothetical protein